MERKRKMLQEKPWEERADRGIPKRCRSYLWGPAVDIRYPPGMILLDPDPDDEVYGL